MFKAYRDVSALISSEIFHRRDINFNLKINSDFAMPNVRSIFHRSESILYFGPKIWDIVPLELKELTTVVALKEKKVLKNGSQKTVHISYVKNTYPI